MLREKKVEVIEFICMYLGTYLEGKQSTKVFKWQKNNQPSGDRI